MICASCRPEAFVGSFSFAPAEILDSNISLYFVYNFLTYLTYILFECNPNKHGPGTMLVLQL